MDHSGRRCHVQISVEDGGPIVKSHVTNCTLTGAFDAWAALAAEALAITEGDWAGTLTVLRHMSAATNEGPFGQVRHTRGQPRAGPWDPSSVVDMSCLSRNPLDATHSHSPPDASLSLILGVHAHTVTCTCLSPQSGPRSPTRTRIGPRARQRRREHLQDHPRVDPLRRGQRRELQRGHHPWSLWLPARVLRAAGPFLTLPGPGAGPGRRCGSAPRRPASDACEPPHGLGRCHPGGRPRRRQDRWGAARAVGCGGGGGVRLEFVIRPVCVVSE